MKNANTKKCSRCHRSKDKGFFGKLSRSKDGLNGQCRECRHEIEINTDPIKKKASQADWNKRNPEKIKEIQSRYAEKNLEKERKRKREYKKNNKNKVKESAKIYSIKNREKIKQRRLNNKESHKKYVKEWAKNNKDKCKRSKEKWYKNNPEKVNLRARELRKNSLQHRIKMNLRTRLYHAIKGHCKSEATLNLLECSIEYFRLYFEGKFKKGMTWENYGKVWHIDHRVPCAMFDLTNPAAQKVCFHYTNLQPLFKHENLTKNAKVKDRDIRFLMQNQLLKVA